jgi:hypothetical protein
MLREIDRRLGVVKRRCEEQQLTRMTAHVPNPSKWIELRCSHEMNERVSAR